MPCHGYAAPAPKSPLAPCSFEADPLGSYDVSEGRQKLKFSTWAEHPRDLAARKLDGISEMATKREMPMPIHTCVHRDAALSEMTRRSRGVPAAGGRSGRWAYCLGRSNTTFPPTIVDSTTISRSPAWPCSKGAGRNDAP